MTPANQEPVRIAVIGAGHLGRFHSRLAAASDKFDLVAVVDPVEASRNQLAEETATDAYARYEDLIGKIDAAVIATPTVTHHKIGTKLLSKGIHCLIEKPLAPTFAEADDLARLADNNDLVLQVGHVERFNPAIQAAGDTLDDPKYITATRTSGYTFRSTDIGAVLDIMIHDIDLVLGIADSEVTGVSAMGVSVLGDHEDMATAQLTFESGCVAHLTASRVSYEMRRDMQVFTPRGFVSLDFTSRQATVVSPRADLLSREFRSEALSVEDKTQLRETFFESLLAKTTTEAPAVNAIELEQAEFASAIRRGTTPRVSGEVGRDAVRVAERVLSAIEEHSWDGGNTGRIGPLAQPSPATLPWQPADIKKAG